MKRLLNSLLKLVSNFKIIIIIMKKQQEQKEKLSLKKFQIAKIKNPQKILGGTGNNGSDDDDDTGNTAKGKK
jgi:hypothetical protein